MKKIVTFFIAMSSCVFSFSQVTFSPSTFTAEDEVTLTVDVSGTAMAGASEAYIWLWSNAGDAVVNTDWANSPDAAKLTSVGTNKWSFKFTGTLLFGKSPGELKEFRFLVKSKNGSVQTEGDDNAFGPFQFDPLVFVPSLLRIFPAKVDSNDVVTLNFDRTYGVTVDEQRMSPTTATVIMFDDNNNQVGQPLNLAITKVNENAWSASFIPTRSFSVTSNRKLSKFKYKFNGAALDVDGKNKNVSTSESEIEFTSLK